MNGQPKRIITWILRGLAALILLQTLFFKFSGAEESVYIFSRLGVEPWGRIASGVAELVAALLILYPATTAFGALLAAGIMAGAVGAHLTVLGISVRGDGGQLFAYALAVLLASLLLAWWQRADLLRSWRRIASPSQSLN